MPEKTAKPPAAHQLRVLVAKVGLDGHDRGVKIVARALRDAGIEVIYLGIHNTPEEIVRSALQEDVDAIGLSIHSAAHLTLFGEVMRLLRRNKAMDIVVFGGGVVPDEDIKKLKKIGVREIFTPGAPLEKVINFATSIAAPEPPERRVGKPRINAARSIRERSSQRNVDGRSRRKKPG